jgi:L-serine deaminase
VAVVRGVLERFLDESVNYVNAEHLAASRGIEIARTRRRDGAEDAERVDVRLETEAGSIEIAGALVGGRAPRVVAIGGYRLEFWPEGRLLVIENRDVPGVVGRLGTLLGEAGVNIGDIHLSRDEARRQALAVLRLDQPPDPATLDRLRALPEVERARYLEIG